MTNAARATAAAAALLVFFLLWAAVAAHPWAPARASAADPRSAQLAAREAALRKHAALVNKIVGRRWAAYRLALRRREAQITAAQLRHLRDLEAAYVSAVAAVRSAQADAAAARAYAARVAALAHG